LSPGGSEGSGSAPFAPARQRTLAGDHAAAEQVEHFELSAHGTLASSLFIAVGMPMLEGNVAAARLAVVHDMFRELRHGYATCWTVSSLTAKTPRVSPRYDSPRSLR
jgi:hypothetical protein